MNACGGAAQLVLKAPIKDRCADAGLRGCEELTDGLLLYVEGDHEEGEAKIKSGAQKNEPDKLQEFAEKVRALKGIPGADAYMKPLFQAADLLAPPEHERARGGSGGEEIPAETTAATDLETRPKQVTRGLAGTVVPAAEDRSYPCPAQRRCAVGS